MINYYLPQLRQVDIAENNFMKIFWNQIFWILKWQLVEKIPHSWKNQKPKFETKIDPVH